MGWDDEGDVCVGVFMYKHPNCCAQAISEEELLAFGITPDFQEFVRSLNYSVFRCAMEGDVTVVVVVDDTKCEQTASVHCSTCLI